MAGETPQETDALWIEAIRRSDAQAASELYEEDAVYIWKGNVIQGRDSIRRAYEEMLAYGPPEFEGQSRHLYGRHRARNLRLDHDRDGSWR